MSKGKKLKHHPLKDYCDEIGMSVYLFSKECGVSFVTLRNITNWKGYPRRSSTVKTLIEASNGAIKESWLLVPEEYERFREQRIKEGLPIFDVEDEA